MESKNTTKVVENSGQFTEGHKKLGGREKGTLNRYTRLKHGILDLADERKAEWKDIDILDLIRVAAGFVPKELKGEGFGGNTKIIIMRPDAEKAEQPETRIPKEISI